MTFVKYEHIWSNSSLKNSIIFIILGQRDYIVVITSRLEKKKNWLLYRL